MMVLFSVLQRRDIQQRRILRTPVQTAVAGGAIAAMNSLLMYDSDISHRAHLRAQTAAIAFIRYDKIRHQRQALKGMLSVKIRILYKAVRRIASVMMVVDCPVFQLPDDLVDRLRCLRQPLSVLFF